MTTFLQYAVLGLGIGGVYALLTQGLVLTYRGAGILNFAAAAMGMFGGFLFWQLRGGIRGTGGIPTVWAFLIGTLTVAAIGVLVHIFIMRPLRNAAALVRVVATLGVLVTVEATASIIWGQQPILFPQFLPTSLISLGSVSIGVNQAIILGVAAAVTALLWVLDRHSILGLLLRANAENQAAAAALGRSPDLLALVAWGAGGALSGAAIILVGTFSGLQTDTASLLIFPMLAVGLIGGFKSFPLTLVGGIVVGMGQSLVAGYVTLSGAGDAFPLLVVIGIVLVRGKGVTLRTGIGERLPGLGNGRVRVPAVIGGAVVVGVLLMVFASAAFDSGVSVSLGWAVVLLSVVVLLGLTGQLSFEQVAMAGLAALIAGRLVEDGWPFLLAFLVSVAAAVPIGVIFALPAIRTKGINLAIVTLALAVTVSDLLFGNASIIGGQSGTPVGEGQTVFGLNINPVTHANRYVIFCLAIFVICSVLVANVRRGSSGRRLIAVRTNEKAAAALGINVASVKLYTFVVGASVAAIGGVLLGFSNSTVDYTQFSPYNSALAVAYAVVGGVGFVVGPLFAAPLTVGGVGSYITSRLWNSAALYLALAGGVLVIVYLIQDPDGLASMTLASVRRMARVFRRGRADGAAPEHRGRDRQTTVIPSSPGVRVGPAEARSGPRPDRRRVAATTLDVSGVSLSYGGVRVLQEVSLQVRSGEVVGLIGPNGAGKTSLMDVISGFARPHRGSVSLGGTPIDGWSVDRRARGGIGRSFQSLELFESSSVGENLGVGGDQAVFPAGLTDLLRPRALKLNEMATTAVEDIGLQAALNERVSDLSYGARRLVAIARAVSTGSSITMLDEPAAGLNQQETAELATVVRQFADSWGMGILLVEHDMTFVSTVCDRIVVLDFGRVIADGPPDEVREDPEVIRAYLGDDKVPETSAPENTIVRG